MMNPLLLPYVPLVEYIGRVFGDHCEVLLHDLTNMEHSIVAISNGSLTGREVGGHITDFGLEIIHDPCYRDEAFAVNYPGSAAASRRTLKSSTFFIRDDAGVPVGLFCINFDITDWLDAQKLLAAFTAFSDASPHEATPQPQSAAIPQELFFSSIEDTLHHGIDRLLTEYGASPQRLTTEEKKEIVEKLHARGLFTLKGAVGAVARRLEVSEQTVYRYLRECQNKDRL